MRRRLPEGERRQRLAAEMALQGCLDSPFVRHFLRGDQMEVWRRTCRCPTDCDCWDYACTRPATAEEQTAFAVAQQPGPPRAQAEGTEDLLARIETDLRRRAPWAFLPTEDRSSSPAPAASEDLPRCR